MKKTLFRLMLVLILFLPIPIAVFLGGFFGAYGIRPFGALADFFSRWGRDFKRGGIKG